jgi:tetratricopeptide (TPR) repeat protein
MTLPKPLVDSVREGRSFLFLGAGASIGAVHPKGISLLNGQQLSNKIAEKFLGPEFKDHPLSQVAELAISETDLFTVQEFIASIYREFEPADFHKMIPKFIWRGIATTNYDLIIERAYDAVKDSLQSLVVFKKDGERIEEKLRLPKNVMYIKLHGCITDINNSDTPLILTPEQYVTHKKGRTRLFEKFQTYAYEYPVIFTGYSLGDLDLRAILSELTTLEDARPRSYIVTPNMTSQEIKLWEGKKITHIPMSFKDFLIELDGSIESGIRALSIMIDKSEPSIYRRLKIPQGSVLSEGLTTFLNRDVEYVYTEMKTEAADPRAFYKGYFVDWSPIAYNLDVKRTITDTILSEVFLPNEEERREICEFYVLKGHAGSGKSVSLKRIAWEAAITFDKIVLFSKQASFIEFEPISELYRLSKERIFLFIDPVTEYLDVIEDIIWNARKEKVPLTIIGGERFNEWNNQCTILDPYISGEYQLGYLSEKEIGGLLILLATHKSLGYLADKKPEEQLEALGKRSGRQLLVALHEATLGKPFSDIVIDEYNSISSKRAQALYLTTCIFHRLNVPIRAGLISRIHGIPFTEFEENLFKPLDCIVFARMNEKIRDYEYRSRHSHIAEIVFERVLSQPTDRYDEYIRIINAIDVDFSSDREAFKGIINARELLNLFRDPQMARQIFEAAIKRDQNNPMLLQQEAIFEMLSPNGSLAKATGLLQRAIKIAPYNRALTHSLSELARKKADSSTNEIEKIKHRQEAKDIAYGLIANGSIAPHPYSTLIKIGLDELGELITTNDHINIEKKIKEIEKIISSAQQIFVDESYIQELEAEFCELINRHEEALKSLEKAFSTNKRNGYIASRLAKIYEKNNRIDEAIKVLEECIEVNPNDKQIHFQEAMLLYKKTNSKMADIFHHLRYSFTIGDTNYIAQFWYARQLYLNGETKDANDIFKRLGDINIDSRTKNLPRSKVLENNAPKRFSGIVSVKQSTYAFIIRDELQDNIFTHQSYNGEKEWDSLSYHKRVIFDLAFNYRGPVATHVRNE